MKTAKPKPDLAFLDKVHDWTFNKRSPNGRLLSREVLAVQAKLRGKLRSAQRFIVDNAAIEIVAGLSREFDRLEAWSFLARLPYDTMWLQFDLHHKIESLRKLDPRMLPVDPELTSPIIAYLLFRDNDGPSPVWIAHEFYLDQENDKPFIGMLTYIFNPEGDTMWPVRGSKYWNAPTLSRRKGFPKIPVQIALADDEDDDPMPIEAYAAPEIALCGIFQPHDGEIYIDPDGTMHAGPGIVTAPDWFVNRGAVIVEPWWDHYFAPQWKEDLDTVHKLLIHEINECRGSMKFLIALLAAINGLPRDVRPILTKPGKRPVGINMLPYLGHSNLTITLPRDNRIVWARRELNRSSHETNSRRQHDVLGHWRIVERGKKMPYLCRHMPTMVENGLGICENCEMLIRWIKTYTRGNSELGMVEHEYEITA